MVSGIDGKVVVNRRYLANETGAILDPPGATPTKPGSGTKPPGIEADIMTPAAKLLTLTGRLSRYQETMAVDAADNLGRR
jgi:hypothetical protein